MHSGMLILMMHADPWPVNDETAAAILAFVNDEARRRGFDDWSVALHDPSLVALAAPTPPPHGYASEADTVEMTKAGGR